MSSKKKPISLLCLVILIVIFCNSSYAKTKNGKLKILNTPPPGFEKETEETLFVDVYYRGKFLITQKARIKDNRIKLLNPHLLLSQLPNIRDNMAGEALQQLSQYSDFKTPYSCYPEREEKCDMLNPKSIELVYNPNILTLEVFANSNIFVKDTKKELYLEPQSKDFAQFFKFNAIGYWSKDKTTLPSDYIVNPLYYDAKNQDLYNININSKTSFERFTLNGDIRYTNDNSNIFADNIYLTRYFERNTLQIGEVITQELRNLNQANILGISFRSSIDRRKKNSGMYAQPINVFLNYRSRVNLIKDGRIYSSQFYDSGSQSLNTESLPSGSYNVEIEIIEPNGQVRRQRQFFVKNGELPPADQPYYWFEFGAVEDYSRINAYNFDIDDSSFNEYRNEYLFRSGIYKRILKPLGLGSNLILNDKISAMEAFTEYFGRHFTIKGSIGVDTEKDYSYTIYSEITNFEKFSLYFTWTQSFLTKDSLDKKYNYRPISSYSKYGSGNIKYYFGNGRNSIGFRGNYYKDIYKIESYSFGPELEFNISIGTSTTMTIALNGYKTDRDYQALLNFSFNFNSRYIQLYNNSTYRINREKDGDRDLEDRFDSSTAITLQDGGIFNQDLRLTGRYDRIDGTETTGAELDYRSGIGRFLADASSNSYINQYSLNFSSVLAFNKNHILFGGREPKESAVAVEIDGGNKNSTFDIFVNENRVDYIKGNSTRVITLNPFNEYSISLQPNGVNNTYIENGKLKTITLYPGSMETIKYKAKSTVIIIGTLYTKGGKILKNTKISGEIDETTTDNDGYFQITATLGETLKVGNSYEVKIPSKLKTNKENILFVNKLIAQRINQLHPQQSANIKIQPK